MKIPFFQDVTLRRWVNGSPAFRRNASTSKASDQVTWHHVPDDQNRLLHYCGSPKSRTNVKTKLGEPHEIFLGCSSLAFLSEFPIPGSERCGLIVSDVSYSWDTAFGFRKWGRIGCASRILGSLPVPGLVPSSRSISLSSTFGLIHWLQSSCHSTPYCKRWSHDNEGRTRRSAVPCRQLFRHASLTGQSNIR